MKPTFSYVTSGVTVAILQRGGNKSLVTVFMQVATYSI